MLLGFSGMGAETILGGATGLEMSKEVSEIGVGGTTRDDLVGHI